MAVTRKVCVVASLLAVVSLGCFPTPSLSAPKGMPPGSANVVLGAVQVPGGDWGPTMGLRYGILPRLNVGADMDVALRVDARFQVVGEPFPLDADVELGAGALVFLIPYRYVGFAVGVHTPGFAPYVRYRYCSVQLAATDSGFQDLSDDHDIGVGIWWAQLSVGAEIHLNDHMSLVPEYTKAWNMYDATTEDDLSIFSVGLRFGRW